MRHPSNLACAVLATVAIAALVACTRGPAGSSSPSDPAVTAAQPTAQAAGTPTASPTPTATPAPAPDVTPAPTPTGGFAVFIEDPGIVVTFPEDWAEMSAPEIRAQLDLAEDGGLAPDIVADVRARIDEGRIRVVGTGSTPGGVGVSIAVAIEPALTTLDQATDFARQQADTTRRGSPVSVTPVAFSLGQGILAHAQHEPISERGIPSQIVVYAVALRDGRYLVVSSTGTQDDATFEPMMEAVMASMTEATAPPAPTPPASPDVATTTAEIDDAGVRLQYPKTWTRASLDALQASIASLLETTTGTTYDGYRWLGSEIESGEMRFAANDPTGGGGSLFVLVESGDADLAAAVARRSTELGFLSTKTVARQRDMDLPFGPAVRIDMAGSTPFGPAVAVEVVTMLPDGRTMTLYGIPGTDPDFDDLIGWIGTSVQPT